MLALAAATLSAYDGRALHWVIRVSSLEDTLSFVKEVLGMKVLRHEENEAACPITCNGRFETPWSKTMVGYNPEDAAYALELTYNYGIAHYEVGNGLRRFVLTLPETAKKLARAKELGYALAGTDTVIGPDGYSYVLRDAAAMPSEPFAAVVLRAADAAGLAQWYGDVLGMETRALSLPEATAECAPGATKCVELRYPGRGAVRFLLSPWSGYYY